MIYWIRQFFSRPRNHGRALAEVAITTVFSILPLVITALNYNRSRPGEFHMKEVIWQALGRGQLYLYAYGLVGTIFWLAFLKSDKEMHAPRRVLGTIAILIAFLIVPFMGIDPSISNIRNNALVGASWWVYGFFLFVNYLLLFYIEIDPPNPEQTYRAGASKLKNSYIEMGGTQ